MLGKEGEGFKIAMATLDGGRIGIAAQALGIAQGAFEHALAYAKERVQFGKPIGAQQIISFKLADMATKLRCARYLIYSAAELKEQHQPYGMESAMAKMYASDIALEVTNDALQILADRDSSREWRSNGRTATQKSRRSMREPTRFSAWSSHRISLEKSRASAVERVARQQKTGTDHRNSQEDDFCRWRREGAGGSTGRGTGKRRL